MMKKKVFFFLTHPLVLTLLFGILIIIFFLPSFFNKYIIQKKDYYSLPKTTVNTWFDFDNDGYSEEINMYNTPNQPIVILRKNSQIVSQWKLHGEFVHNQYFFTADYNRDHNSELYLITLTGDSLMLYGIQPFKEQEKLFFRMFFDTYQPSVLGTDCVAYFIKAADLNMDGFNELVFSISTGWSAYPRKIYAIDVHNNSYITTPPACVTMINPISFDINHDGFDEYIPESSAFGNCSETDPFSDHHAWIVVFDKNLQFVFNPISIGQYKSIVKTRPIKEGRHTYLVSLQTHTGIESIENKILLHDPHGKLIREKSLEGFPSLDNATLLNKNASEMDKVYLILNNGSIWKIDTSLNVKKEITIEGLFLPTPGKLDVDDDGIDEFIFNSKSSANRILTRNSFTDPVIINTPEASELPGLPYYFSVKKRGNDDPLLYFQYGGHCYFFDYYTNPLFLFRYLIFAGIFTILYGIFFLIQKAQKMRERIKYEKEKNIAELQLKSVKGQTDPHFTLNLLNSLRALSDRHDQEKADYIFGKYAKLLRTTILDSENPDRSLKAELDYVESYLELEKFRYNDKFTYNISIDPVVNTEIPIPKMLIHTFIENAVKHGIRHLDKDGLITVKVERAAECYLISVSDNGVGRKKSADFSIGSTGQGMKILDNILSLYYDLKGVRISYHIIDSETTNPGTSGTSAIIKLPIEKRKISIYPYKES